MLTPSQNYYTGRVDIAGRGQGYIIVEDLEDDIFVKNENLNKSLNGDIVEVYVFKRKRGGKSEGEVTRIIQRKKTEFVGTIQIQPNFAFVEISDHKMYTDIFIPKGNIGDAKNGEKVLVEMLDWPDKADSPTGKVLKSLGMPGEHDTEIHSILAQYGLPYEFPKEVENYANTLNTDIDPDEIKKRRDMRDILTFTIDPKDAKDFDDALSFRVLENGNLEFGIHIADVSHYVTPGNVLDDEAYERATSVYLVDRVVPMLPEILSNNACSLRPNEEKYTFSAVFEMNEKAEMINKWFGKTVTLSDARFSYEEAQFIIENPDLSEHTIPEDISINDIAYTVQKEVSEAVLKMDKIAKILRSERMRAGALSFDKVEVKFILDENNNPEGVYFKESNSTATSLNKLLEEVQGKKEQNLIDTLTIRSMSKAVYTTNNIGHYGLAFDYYTHFTSPIRRYPDIMVHRLLQRYLDNGKTAKADEFEEKCAHSSEMEGLAASAERHSVKYMQVKYMMDHQHEDFLGVISGVTEWGIYVEIISNKCEGMVRLQDLRDDHYIFDREEFAVVGQKKHTVYRLGDEVNVKVKNADLVKKHLDFIMLGHKN